MPAIMARKARGWMFCLLPAREEGVLMLVIENLDGATVERAGARLRCNHG